MSPVAVVDKRFRRAHVKPGRKRRRWQSIARPIATYLAVAVLFVYGCYRASAIAAHARVLQVNRIVLHGNERLSRDDVLAVLNGLPGESVVWTDLDRWRRRLLASPWVRDAALRRSLPSTIEIAIAERQPVGIGRINGEMFLVDERGMVIDRYGPQYADLDLPIVDGLGAAPNAAAGTLTDEERADLAARLIAAVKSTPKIARRVSQIDVSDPHDATAILSGDTAVIHLGEDQFLHRLESYLQMEPALRERVADIDYVDVRFDDRIYVRPAPAPKGARRGGAAAGTQQARPKGK